MDGQWAPDPHGRHEMRYWDGRSWTEHVSDGGVTSVEDLNAVPAPNGPATDQYSQQYSGQHPPQYPGQQANPYPGAPPAVGYATKKKADGKMMGAGVMSIVAASIGLMIGLWLFSVTTSDVGGWADDLTGGSITFAALFTLAVSGAWLYVGISTCKGNDWARVTVLVGNAILGGLTLIGALSDPGEAGGAVIPLAWFGTIIFLAATGKAIESR